MQNSTPDDMSGTYFLGLNFLLFKTTDYFK